MSKLSVTCSGFRPLFRNTLRGFADVRIAELCLTIRDVALHEKGHARWAQLPAKPMIRDGALVRDGSGKVQYVPLLHFDNRAVSDAFGRAVIAAVTEFAPAWAEQDEPSYSERLRGKGTRR